MKQPPSPADYIQPLYINGLNGRMLHMPAPKGSNLEMLVVYGHHALLERWWGLVQNFNDFGAVTMPDLPGFGGMDSFYKIGKAATIDNYADYLAAFIKMRYKHRRVVIVGISFGFVVATRMLQRYPELVPKVDFLVSAVGFMHRDDFLFTKWRWRFYRYGAALFSTPLLPFFFRHIGLNAPMLRLVYSRTHNAKHKFNEVTGKADKFRQMMDLEIRLWQENDVRTYMKTTTEFLTLDNCKKPVNLPVWHVCTKHDFYFNNDIIEQHMRVVFSGFNKAYINIKTHAPSILADKKASAIMLPPKVRRALLAAAG